MMGRTEPSRRVLCGRQLLAAAIVGPVLVCLPAAALLLSPDGRGYGTHEQLGLPPCTMMIVFGIRCPTCGMTTAFAHTVRGEFVEAFRANAAGVLPALLSAPVGLWMCLSALRGRWLLAAPSGVAVAAIAVGFLVIAIIDWILRFCLR